MVAQGNVGLAFGLTAAAGLCTTIGAALAFFASVCKPRILAASLAFSAGVMLYVSFVEIFTTKSIDGFVSAGHSLNTAQLYATLCFFGGVVAVYILDGLVHLITDLAVHVKKQELRKFREAMSVTSLKSLLSRKQTRSAPATAAAAAPPLADVPPAPGKGDEVDVEAAVPPAEPAQEPLPGAAALQSVPGLAPPVAGGTASVPYRPPEAGVPRPSTADAAIAAALEARYRDDAPFPADAARLGSEGETGAGGEDTADAASQDEATGPNGLPVPRDPDVVRILQADHHQFALKKMGMLTALAIFIHNFPEGLATFVGTLADASVGATIAFAIAIHNIPEGICVALPIYYATGSKKKGFFWAFMSGISEPLGGLFGWLILYDTGDLMYAIVFGIVAGMMVCISLKELLPTAFKFDSSTQLVMAMLFLGMVVMAASLILFKL